MSELVIPVVSKHRLTKNEFKKIYMCPADKTHSIVDVTMFFDMPAGNKNPTYVTFYLSNSGSYTSESHNDLLISRVVLGVPEVTPELGKIIVGKNQHLYAEIIGEGPVNIRVSGLEEKNPLVKVAGRCAGFQIGKIGIHEVYRLDNPLATYGSYTLAISNRATGVDDEIIVWVTDNVEVKSVTEAARLVDRVAKLGLEVGETAFIENITLAPNERIYVSTKTTAIVFSLNGLVVSAT